MRDECRDQRERAHVARLLARGRAGAGPYRLLTSFPWPRMRLVDRPEPEPVLVSACLLGRACRYDGRHNRDQALERELEARGQIAMPFCPEEHGGLGTPRPAAWIEAESAAEVLDERDRVVTKDGRDVTA